MVEVGAALEGNEARVACLDEASKNLAMNAVDKRLDLVRGQVVFEADHEVVVQDFHLSRY